MAKEKTKYQRRISYELYPTAKQETLLLSYLNNHRHLYNALLEQRNTIFRQHGISFSFEDQCKEITKLRHEDPAYEAINAQSLQVTADRLNKAFQNFFRRVKLGETPGYSQSKTDSNQPKAGYPRFKSRNRHKGFGYKAYGDGWKLHNNSSKRRRKMKNGYLDLSGIGKIQIRGSSQHEGTPKRLDIIYKAGQWKASIVINVLEINRTAGSEAAGFDWGTDKFLTLALENEKYESVENPRNGQKLKQKLEKAHQELAKKKRGSKNREKSKKKLQEVYGDIKNNRDNFLHQESSKLIKRFGLLATEELAIQSLVKKNANEGKHGLNREILDTAPSRFLSMLNYKAEEAGSLYGEIDTKKWKPSQRCSGCGDLVPKELKDRWHICSYCGTILKRDENSARLCLNVQMYGRATRNLIEKIPRRITRKGREPTYRHESRSSGPMTKQESPSIADHISVS